MAYALLLATGRSLFFFDRVGAGKALWQVLAFLAVGFWSDLAMCLLAKGWHF